MAINCRISPDLDNLSKYNTIYSWIPGPGNIRPDKDTIIAKNKLFNQINAFYQSTADYILAEIFNTPIEFNKNGKLHVKTIISNEFKFIKNKFPYKVPDYNTNHYVIWYTYAEIPNDNQINTNIEESIYKILGKRNFKYVWYENPKMNIPGIYHLQVFWIEAK